MPFELRDGAFLVSDDRALLDFSVVHGFLTQCYWSAGISMEQLRRQTEHSTLVFGLYHEEPGAAAARPVQLGFARVLSDLTRFAYLCDVFIVPQAQGRGLGKLLLRAITAHPELTDVRRWLLATKDAHGLYEQFGFVPLPKPEMWMSIPPDKEQPQRWV